MQPDQMLQTLAKWEQAGWLRPLDLAFVRFLHEQAPASQSMTLLAAALTSYQLSRGHICLDLSALPDPGWLSETTNKAQKAAVAELEALLAGITVSYWQQALLAKGQPVVTAAAASAENPLPLVLDGERLYLRRYWQSEQRVLNEISARLARPMPIPADLSVRLATLFNHATPTRPDWQRIACALAARGAFTLITGGPGTGKTTTVVRLLALLQSASLKGQLVDPAGRVLPPRRLRIQLAAPTGKAAARLTESIGSQVKALPNSLSAYIPTRVQTLHQLLGLRPGTRQFRYHAGNPLHVDLLVVDEASMIDLEMMAALLTALPPEARLVLLGDRDQLASVEAGSVLGDLAREAGGRHYDAETVAWLSEVTGEDVRDWQRPGSVGLLQNSFQNPNGQAMDGSHDFQSSQVIGKQMPPQTGASTSQVTKGQDLHLQSSSRLANQIVMLQYSHRFGADSGIGQLARAVNAGDHRKALSLLEKAGTDSDIRLLPLQGVEDKQLIKLCIEGEGNGNKGPVGYGAYLRLLQDQRPPADASAEQVDAWAWAVLKEFERFQLLAAVQQGPWGVAGLNERIAQALQRSGLITATQGWYEGRPVLVTRNDYSLGLMNGDIGITLAVPAGQGNKPVLRVVFPLAEGRLKYVLPARLAATQTVFAMTVHKSQGSEFEHTALVLPDTDSPVLTRELVYTGITRARQWFTLLAPQPAILTSCIKRRTRRASGLGRYLNSE